MSHSIQIMLIGNQIINIGEREVDIRNIASIEIGDNYRVKAVKFKNDEKLQDPPSDLCHSNL